jgi:hypothetical protein
MKRGLSGILFLIMAAIAPEISLAQEWHQLIQKGRLAAGRHDYDAALQYYLTAAKNGTPAAMNAAGYIYLDHKNDPARAFFWCTAASRFEHAIDFGCLMAAKERLTPQQVSEVQKLADQCVASRYKSCDQLGAKQSAPATTIQSKNCIVADPTGTPLNLRTSPNGKVISTIRNGSPVTIIDDAADSQGRAWSYIRSDVSRANLGWVIKSFLGCGAPR